MNQTRGAKVERGREVPADLVVGQVEVLFTYVCACYWSVLVGKICVTSNIGRGPREKTHEDDSP